MRKVFAVLLAVNALFLGALLWRQVSVAQGGTVASANGDVNGDGTIDISDAVYLLSWRFQGGPAPVPWVDGGGPSGLSDTDQTLCYGYDETQQRWTPAPCSEAACHGQDGSYATGCSSEGRFVDNEDGTVTDNCTGLMWQKDSGDVNGDGQGTDQDSASWCDALAYCDYREESFTPARSTSPRDP